MAQMTHSAEQNDYQTPLFLNYKIEKARKLTEIRLKFCFGFKEQKNTDLYVIGTNKLVTLERRHLFLAYKMSMNLSMESRHTNYHYVLKHQVEKKTFPSSNSK